jgi:hypothetical protein
MYDIISSDAIQPGQLSNEAFTMDQLDSEHNLDKVAKATKLVKDALAQYGEPTMSLEELRRELNKQLKGISLSDLIVEERQKGW